MDTAFFIITNRCTRACPFCFYSTRYLSHPADEMDERGLHNSLQRLAALGVTQLIVTGGEPFLREEIMALLREAGRLRMGRLILTNGDLLNEQNVRGILECGVEGLSISVHSMAEAKRRESSIAKIQQSSRIRLSATIVFDRKNIGDLRALEEWARRHGMGTIFQPAYIPAGSEQFDIFSPHRLSSAQWEATVRFLREWGSRERMAHYVDYILSLYGPGGSLRPQRCAMGSSAIVLDCDGSVYPCFHRRDLKAGNLLKSHEEIILTNLERASREISRARCYGEHCVSLFYGSGVPQS